MYSGNNLDEWTHDETSYANGLDDDDPYEDQKIADILEEIRAERERLVNISAKPKTFKKIGNY